MNTPAAIQKIKAVTREDTSPHTNGTLQAQINMLSDVDPLAYYAALDFLAPIADWLKQAGRHCRVRGRCCQTLDEVVNALLWEQPEPTPYDDLNPEREWDLRKEEEQLSRGDF